MNPKDNIMHHFLKYDDLCTRLASVSDEVLDNKKFMIFSGSSSLEYDTIDSDIEARKDVGFYEAKEMIRCECGTIFKREKQYMTL